MVLIVDDDGLNGIVVEARQSATEHDQLSELVQLQQVYMCRV